MQHAIPYPQVREGFQVHVTIWSLVEFGRMKNLHWMMMMMMMMMIIINFISTE